MTESCPTKQRLDRETKPLINGVPVEPDPICMQHESTEELMRRVTGAFCVPEELTRTGNRTMYGLPVADPGQLARIIQRMEKSKKACGNHVDEFRELCLNRLTPTEYVLLLQHEIAKALVLIR